MSAVVDDAAVTRSIHFNAPYLRNFCSFFIYCEEISSATIKLRQFLSYPFFKGVADDDGLKNLAAD